jgi:inner membrane transporter RhtA
MPAQAYFVVSAIFHYLGPSFAVLLFARVDVLGVAWLRIVTAAVIFAAAKRPWRRLRDPRVLLWGAVLAAMNCCFYSAIDRLPLGTVAAIEFVPVVVLAALGARTPRSVTALALAVAGVALLANVRLVDAPLGFALATGNALLFAAYIVLADRVAGDDGIGALAAAMIVAAVLVTPLAPVGAFGDPAVLLAGAGVGLCSSVIPYVSDQLALRKLDRATYALMVSLLPATAVLIGLVVLGQLPHAAELAGVALVIAGVALRGSGDASARRPAVGLLRSRRQRGGVRGRDRGPADPARAGTRPPGAL